MTDTPTIPDILTAAAAELRAADTAASPVPWNPLSLDGRTTIWCGPRENGYLVGSVLYSDECDDCAPPSPADLNLICLLRPLAASLADLFDKLAWLVRLDAEFAGRVGVEEAIAVARAVLYGAEDPAQEAVS